MNQNNFIKLASNLSSFLASAVVVFFMAYVAIEGDFTIKVVCLTVGIITSLVVFLYDVPLGVFLSLFSVVAMISSMETYIPQSLVSYVAGFGLGAFWSLLYRVSKGGTDGNRS